MIPSSTKFLLSKWQKTRARAGLRRVCRELSERVIIVRASLRFVWGKMTERVIIVCHRHCPIAPMFRLPMMVHSDYLQVFQDPLCCSNSADGTVEGLLQACSFWVFVAKKMSFSRGRKMCAMRVGTCLAVVRKPRLENREGRRCGCV